MTSLNIYFKDTGQTYSNLTTNKIRINQAKQSSYRNRSMGRVESSKTGYCDLMQKSKFKHQIALH